MKKILLAGAVLAVEEIKLKPTMPPFANLGNIEPGPVISTLIIVILIVAVILALIYLLIGGAQWITSGGDKARTEAARGKITAALVGLVIVFLAWAIIFIINTLFGIDIFKLTIPVIGQ